MSILDKRREENPDKLIFGNLNINSVYPKFDQMKFSLQGKVDILILTETKLDESFPTTQFLIEGYSKPFRLDRNRNGGGLLVYIREDIPSKELKSHTLAEDIEGIFIEINLRKCKWLLFATYHPPSQCDKYFFDQVSRGLDIYSTSYDKFVLIGDFNAEESEEIFSYFLKCHNASNIVKEKTCLKSLDNPSCIDLIITNKPGCFQNTVVTTTGLSDCHKFVTTVLKASFKKALPKEIFYRDYKSFDKEVFQNELYLKLNNGLNIKEYDLFEKIFLELLDEHAPIKKKFLRANNAPYMTKALRKAIMKRSELKSKYFKNQSTDDFKLYKKHKNYCSKLYKKERKRYYNSMNLTNLNDNRRFWKTVKPFLSDKGSHTSKINLVNNEEVISDEIALAETFSKFYENTVKNLGISEEIHTSSNFKSSDPVDIAISKYRYHPSILKIKEFVGDNTPKFQFSEINLENIVKEIRKLNISKKGTFKNISPKSLLETLDVSGPILLNIWNEGILKDCIYPNKLKLADVSPVFKKENPLLAKNYRPVSVLPTVTKIFEKIMQNQLNKHINRFLSPFLCGYRTGFSTQTALLLLIEKWKTMLDNKGYTGAILMDLSKAFDTINYELLVAKLNVYGFSNEALKLILSYLRNRKQRVKVNTTFSSWVDLICGVPQGSVLGPILFNIFLNDLFFFLNDINICNFADDTTPFVCDLSLTEVVNKLEANSEIAVKWFKDNCMKLNSDKCHLLMGGYKHEHIWAQIDKDKIWESNEVKLLGVTIDNNLKFDSHINKICVKANQKLSVLSRMRNVLTFEQRRVVFKSFFESQFKYCPLIWMFCSRKANNKINKLHERALRIVYEDNISTFEELLEKDNSFSIHHQNIQTAAIEMYKYHYNVSESSFYDVFQSTRNSYNLRSQSDLEIPSVNTENFGKNSLKYFGPIIWNSVPARLRNIENLSEFKKEIRKWRFDDCPCRLCKNFIGNVGFI